ncbi:hypothetical protein B0H13DRAFT_1905089 [Mycena leptocephala]|nr:hypothetical protein B0H13DRAFT_1905089 [Mycena leptocephala]
MYGRFLTKAANLVSFRVSITKAGDSLALKIWSTTSYLNICRAKNAYLSSKNNATPSIPQRVSPTAHTPGFLVETTRAGRGDSRLWPTGDGDGKGGARATDLDADEATGPWRGMDFDGEMSPRALTLARRCETATVGGSAVGGENLPEKTATTTATASSQVADFFHLPSENPDTCFLAMNLQFIQDPELVSTPHRVEEAPGSLRVSDTVLIPLAWPVGRSAIPERHGWERMEKVAQRPKKESNTCDMNILAKLPAFHRALHFSSWQCLDAETPETPLQRVALVDDQVDTRIWERLHKHYAKVIAALDAEAEEAADIPPPLISEECVAHWDDLHQQYTWY